MPVIKYIELLSYNKFNNVIRLFQQFAGLNLKCYYSIGMCVIVPDRLYFVVTDKYHKMGVATYKVLCAKSVKALREMLLGFGFEILRYRK